LTKPHKFIFFLSYLKLNFISKQQMDQLFWLFIDILSWINYYYFFPKCFDLDFYINFSPFSHVNYEKQTLISNLHMY